MRAVHVSPVNMRVKSVCRCAEEARGRMSDRTCALANVCELTLQLLYKHTLSEETGGRAGARVYGMAECVYICDIH